MMYVKRSRHYVALTQCMFGENNERSATEV
jgi:hypothetical protein